MKAQAALKTGDEESPDRGLLRLSPRVFLQQFARQTPAFWMLCAYFMVEYVRPQSVWPAIGFLPWGMGTLLLALLLFVVEQRKVQRRLTVIDGTLIVFSIVLVLSSIMSTYPQWSRLGLEFYINWLIIFVLVAGLVTSPRRYFLFIVPFLLWNLKMSQHASRTFAARGFAFANWGATGAPGWFHNSGEFAIQMCIFLPISYYFMMAAKPYVSRWVFWAGMAAMPGTAILGSIASSSRGGQLGIAAVIFMIIAHSRHRVRGLVAAGVLLSALWAFMPVEQKARFSEMGEDGTSQSRLTYWKDGIEIMNKYPVFGIGYDAWEPYYRQNYNPYGELPHNIFVEAGSEMGYSGLLGFIAMIGATLIANRRTRRMSRKVPEWGRFLYYSSLGLDGALLGFLVSGFFVTVLFYPYFWVNLACAAGLHEAARRSARAVGRSRRGDVEQQRVSARVALPTA